MFEGMVDRAFSRTSKYTTEVGSYSAARTSPTDNLPPAVGLELAAVSGAFGKKS
jgi:hypothetical protein